MDDLYVYTWIGVLNDYTPGKVTVVAASLDQARLAASTSLTNDSDRYIVKRCSPSSVVKLTIPFVILELGSM